MKTYNQRNPIWANETIGNTRIKVGKMGCTICSLCSIHSKFYPNNPLSPLEACKMFTFNSIAEILWNKTDFAGMKFIWRGYWYDKGKIKEYAKDKNKGVIVELNKNHWVAVHMWASRPRILDPWDGKAYWGIPSKYKVTGFALFERVEATIPEWASKDWLTASKMGIAPKDPFKKIQVNTDEQKVLGVKSPEQYIPAYQYVHALMKFARRLKD